MDMFLHTYVTSFLWAHEMSSRIRNALGERNERGEGVVSAAIAILIIAAVGAAGYALFKGVFDNAAGKAGDKVNSIGG